MVAKKTTAKKKTTTKRKSSAKKQPVVKSFRVAQPEQPFFQFKISRQTIYWTILVAFIIIMQLWILKVQFEVMHVTDTLNQQIMDSAAQ